MKSLSLTSHPNLPRLSLRPSGAGRSLRKRPIFPALFLGLSPRPPFPDPHRQLAQGSTGTGELQARCVPSPLLGHHDPIEQVGHGGARHAGSGRRAGGGVVHAQKATPPLAVSHAPSRDGSVRPLGGARAPPQSPARGGHGKMLVSQKSPKSHPAVPKKAAQSGILSSASLGAATLRSLVQCRPPSG